MNINKLAQRATVLGILFAIILGTVAPTFAQRRRRPARRSTAARRATTPAPRYYTVPADTVIRVRMNQQLSSRTARVGDRFSANVTEPVYAGGGTEVIPVGSKVWGRVSSVRRAGRRTPGTITVGFNQVELPSGVRHAINGSLTTLQADDVNADNEGSVEGRKNDKRNAVFIGGGAATGAIIGAIAGGGKGAAIGAAIGAGAGASSVYIQGREELVLRSGTELTVRASR